MTMLPVHTVRLTRDGAIVTVTHAVPVPHPQAGLSHRVWLQLG